MNDETPTPAPIPAKTISAFARELRRLAAQVERDLARDEHVSALSALTAIKPLTGALSDAALSKVMADAPVTQAVDPEISPNVHNPCGYL